MVEKGWGVVQEGYGGLSTSALRSVYSCTPSALFSSPSLPLPSSIADPLLHRALRPPSTLPHPSRAETILIQGCAGAAELEDVCSNVPS